jgi:hypothetical protein
MLKAPLLRQEDEAIAKTQNRKGGAISQPKILAELLRNRKLALFADPSRRQVFESSIVGCH